MPLSPRIPRGSLLTGLIAAFLLVGCGGSTQAEYLHDNNKSYSKQQTMDLEGDPGSTSLNDMRFKPDVCRGVDLTPHYTRLDYDDLIKYLRAQSHEVELEKARNDLVYLTVKSPGHKPVRLRVAILKSASEAGRDLHVAVLEHGPGSWGVHRANLAVLAPIGDMNEIVYFATRARLACWGELIVAGRDDSFVIPGGYREP